MLLPMSFPKDATVSEAPAPQHRKTEIREIVFFGRLEIRKGLKLFCDAVDELCADRANRKFQVTFLGKETQLYGRSSIGYISDRSKAWSVPWHLVSNKYQGPAIEYLRGAGRLAVVSSLADNYPNTVLECVGAGVPLLASNVGGIPEIIDPADRETSALSRGHTFWQNVSEVRWSTAPFRRARRPHSPTPNANGWICISAFRIEPTTSSRLQGSASRQRINLSPGERLFRLQR